ncbi:hypothetical protein AB2B41_21900 [Marimonas sp. MJW-29]|uniref:Uncharacterized protein n=1 Tax=Sulfitobacter sediminis TaxID=3234186 RepID=A0ABV3RU98_9RHOB
MKTLGFVLLALAASAGTPASATDAVRGKATTFTSPKGVGERCVRIAAIPGGEYSKGDLEEEAIYCGIDLYAPDVALCPKTWSTSPGMMVYDISGGPYANDRSGFERNACKEGKSADRLSDGDLAKFKVTMNAKGTSGTFSASPLLYYHFSRYFDMTVKVPVSVWRTMDVAMHASEVARPGLAISGHNRSARMNHAGWQHLVDAEVNPSSYRPTDDIFTADLTQIYGVLTSSPGHRYGSEINGTRRSGWGAGQNLDFQETPAFLALRHDAQLVEAIDAGLREGRKDGQINRDLGPDVPREQMAYWMREISEIVLLDFIFSQQDRVGNIDFTPYYYWIENGDLAHKKARHHEPGDSTVPAGAMLLRRTNLNDNDAGGRVAYANFAKSTQMLEKLRHFDGKVYARLISLDRDLQNTGPIYQWLASSLGLKESEVAQVVKNTRLATGILQDSCKAGKLRFDLNPKQFFLLGDVTPDEMSCDGS